MVEGVIFLKLIILLIFILFTARIDAQHLNKREWIENHTPRFVQRMMFVIGLIIGFDINIFEALAYPLLFWGFFDQALNSMRKGVSLFYIGDTAKTDSFARLYPHVYWGSKIISIIGGFTLLYFYVYG